jgi:hypothetical protein
LRHAEKGVETGSSERGQELQRAETKVTADGDRSYSGRKQELQRTETGVTAVGDRSYSGRRQ